jgi:hypothetical protein
MPKVHALQAAVVRVGGMPIGIKQDQAFDRNDPVVQEHRWLFGLDVEEATARPGERRSATR